MQETHIDGINPRWLKPEH